MIRIKLRPSGADLDAERQIETNLDNAPLTTAWLALDRDYFGNNSRPVVECLIALALAV